MTVGTVIFTLIICRSGPVLWIRVLRRLSWGQSASPSDSEPHGVSKQTGLWEKCLFWGEVWVVQSARASLHRIAVCWGLHGLSYRTLSSLFLCQLHQPKRRAVDLVWHLSSSWENDFDSVFEDGRIVPKNNTRPYVNFTLRKREKGFQGKLA